MLFKEEIKEALLKHWDEEDRYSDKWKQPFYDATDSFRRTLSEEMYKVWDAGRSEGMAVALQIIQEVYDDQLRKAVEKNPKMSLKTFCKNKGIVE